MVFLSWLVSGAWTCHRSVVQIPHLYSPTELIEIYNLRPIPRPWHRDKARLSSKNWRYEGPPTSVILFKNRLFPGLNIWIYAEFYGDFQCAIEKFPSPSKWWVISNLLFIKKSISCFRFLKGSYGYPGVPGDPQGPPGPSKTLQTMRKHEN